MLSITFRFFLGLITTVEVFKLSPFWIGFRGSAVLFTLFLLFGSAVYFRFSACLRIFYFKKSV